MKALWNKSICSKKWKILIYNAIVISQLIYGLETIPMNQNQITRLNAFQMKGFRKILKIHHPFYSRVSNDDVWQRINQFKPGDAPIKSIAEMLRERKTKLLAHCIRSEPTDPIRMPILNMTNNRMIEIHGKD